MDIKISPSMLASDFANLENELKKCKTGGADTYWQPYEDADNESPTYFAIP